MSIYFLKTLLSVVMVLVVLVNVFTMFEAFGRGEKGYDVNKLKRIHRINGLFFLSIFLFVTYFCFCSIIFGQMVLSPRAAFHSVFALAVILLLALKVSFIGMYRQFYGKVLIISLGWRGVHMKRRSAGIVIAFLLVSCATITSQKRDAVPIGDSPQRGTANAPVTVVGKDIKIKTDPDSVNRGEKLFDTKCIFCHDAEGIGPGLKGVLKNENLPVSKRPATPENIRHQLREPFKRMPPFSNLTEEEVGDIIAFLNTL